MSSDWALGDAGPLEHAGGETHVLRDLMRTLQTLMPAFTRDVGVSTQRLALLRLLAMAGDEGVGTAALARAQGLDPAGVTRALSALVAEGLAERRPHATDGRRARFVLTPEGRKAFETLHERMHAFEAGLVAGISREDLVTMAEVLAALCAAAVRTEGP